MKYVTRIVFHIHVYMNYTVIIIIIILSTYIFYFYIYIELNLIRKVKVSFLNPFLIYSFNYIILFIISKCKYEMRCSIFSLLIFMQCSYHLLIINIKSNFEHYFFSLFELKVINNS